MIRSDQIDIVYALDSELEEDVSQAIDRDLFSASAAADFIVLAEDAAQRATGEEYRSAAALSGFCRNLTVVL